MVHRRCDLAAENEIVYGYGDGRFIPGRNITREEAVTMLARFVDYSGAELENTAGAMTFTDEPPSADGQRTP